MALLLNLQMANNRQALPAVLASGFAQHRAYRYADATTIPGATVPGDPNTATSLMGS